MHYQYGRGVVPRTDDARSGSMLGCAPSVSSSTYRGGYGTLPSGKDRSDRRMVGGMVTGTSQAMQRVNDHSSRLAREKLQGSIPDRRPLTREGSQDSLTKTRPLTREKSQDILNKSRPLTREGSQDSFTKTRPLTQEGSQDSFTKTRQLTREGSQDSLSKTHAYASLPRSLSKDRSRESVNMRYLSLRDRLRGNKTSVGDASGDSVAPAGSEAGGARAKVPTEATRGRTATRSPSSAGSGRSSLDEFLEKYRFGNDEPTPSGGQRLSRAGKVPVTHVSVKSDDSTDGGAQSHTQSSPSKAAKRASSAPPTRRSIFTLQAKASTVTPSTPSTTTPAGSLDESSFFQAFEDVPKVQIFSGRDVEEMMTRIREVLQDEKNDWEKRVDSLRRVRSVVIAGGMDYDEFHQNLRSLETPIQTSAKDLRSQVVRECCITIAFLAQHLCNKFEHFADSIFLILVALIPNSAKIMASSGVVALRFIIQHTHSPKMIPLLVGNLSSKTKEIRRQCAELLDQMLHTWPTHSLERHIAVIQDAIRKGIADADPEARTRSRKAFWGFSDHFKEQADSLLQSLDSSKQKLLQGEMSNSSSSNSVNSAGRVSTRRTPAVRTSSRENVGAAPRRSHGTISTRGFTSPSTDGIGKRIEAAPAVRSNSAIDSSAVQRARARASAVGPVGRVEKGSYNSLPRSAKGGPVDHGDGRQGRSRVSHSQPGSRSNSPSSRYSYQTYAGSGDRKPRRSGIPRSTGTSRETSPSRLGGGYARDRRLSAGAAGSRSGRGAVKPGGNSAVLAQRVLLPGQETEAALSDALRGPLRRRYDNYHSDDESETSSICSEKSYGSYRSEDIAEIVNMCSSTNWSERKEALTAVQNICRHPRTLSRAEIRKLTECFTRLFMDPHSKVFSMFLDMLMDFVSVYRNELHDWLYVLLTRLLSKMGADMLGSVHSKCQRALDLVRESFPYDQQLIVTMKFIIDQTQTPNLKVKVALLTYMLRLIDLMEAEEFTNSSDTRLAVSRIITWTNEPKSSEIRKLSQMLLIALFNLNTAEFSMLLSALPKTFQDSATKILNSHLTYVRNGSSSNGDADRKSPIKSPSAAFPGSGGAASRRTPATTPTSTTAPRHHFDAENMNPEEIYKSLRQTTREIQNYSFEAALGKEEVKHRKERDTTSQDSGIQSSLPDVRGDSPDASKCSPLCLRIQHSPAAHDSAARSRIPMPRSRQGSATTDHSPIHRHAPHSPSMAQPSPTALHSPNSSTFPHLKNGYDRAALAEAVFDVENEIFNEEFPDDQNDVIAEILTELSNHNERFSEREDALKQLMRLVRDGSRPLWEEHFKTVLLMLLETLGDTSASIRTLSLRVLREIMHGYPQRFDEYAELTMLRILEAHRDGEKEVARAAEDAAATLATVLPRDTCVRVLRPIVETSDFPVSYAAIKMLQKVVEAMSEDEVRAVLPDVVPGLVKGYDATESAARKASCFCLVAIHLAVGDDLLTYLSDLNGSKMKLLNLYIKRAQQTTQQTTPTPPR
ncbi:PREDICTED: CLIP-associating protein 2-like isoform X2 [Priapulus caudatus]|uniref:CLIP-associating protein 2-like isoform X2 n=1 Tax=Priapulus caudatus TaxID=37621 RepID=A0ABM1DSX7_PRICU|nr:PREDICTED: CLIP-associating protein 2-like isoform X2 [Priapulus caudatus]